MAPLLRKYVCSTCGWSSSAHDTSSDVCFESQAQECADHQEAAHPADETRFQAFERAAD